MRPLSMLIESGALHEGFDIADVNGAHFRVIQITETGVVVQELIKDCVGCLGDPQTFHLTTPATVIRENIVRIES